MSKNKLSTCIALMAGSFFSSQVTAQSTVNVYGLVDAGVEISKSGLGTDKRLISGGTGGSRVGYRGTENLGNGWSVIFNLETGIAIDTGEITQGGRGFGRAANIGISNTDFGTLHLGLVNLPYYIVQSKVDAFDWRGSGGLMAISTPTNTSLDLVMPVTTSARASNALSFTSKKINGLQIRALGAFSEKSTTQGNTYSISGSYDNSFIELVTGYAKIDSANNNSGEAEAYVFGGNIKLDKLKVFSGYTVEKNSCQTCTGAIKMRSGIRSDGEARFDLINLGARYTQGNLTLITQAARILDKSDYVRDVGSKDITWYSVGAEYTLSKRTLAYATFGTLKNKNGSTYALGSGTAAARIGSVSSNSPRASTAVIGIRHTF